MIHRFTVGGMHAVHARRAVETALSGVDGVVMLDVTLGTVVVEHHDATEVGRLRAAIEAAGFVVLATEPMPRRLRIVRADVDGPATC